MAKDTEKVEEYPLPEGYEDRTPGFARAFAHAKRHNNSDKAALLFAESWDHEFEYQGEEE